MKLILGQVLIAIMFFPFLATNQEAVATTNYPNIGVEGLMGGGKWMTKEENPLFRNIKVKGEGGKYEISGEARPATGEFFYTVEDGHVQFIDETRGKTTDKYPQWETFNISISLEGKKLPENGVLILNLYERGEEGKIIHLFPVVLERFYSELK